MTIFRGPGGTGSATSDSDTTEFQEFLVQSQAARDAAVVAKVAAETAETNAETAEVNAETAQTNAAVSASSAVASANNAAASAVSSASSATDSSSSASDAATSASSAAASASAAVTTLASTVKLTGAQTISGTKTFSASQIINVTDNTNAALRVTQLGTGNALLVEDSTNPDSTPVVIDANGKVVAGYTTPITTSGSFSPLIQSVAAGQTAGFGTSAWVNSTAGGNVLFAKSRSGTIGTFQIVNSGDALGAVRFDGDDGTQFVRAAQILAEVDGTPGVSDMPGRLVFSTTAEGAASPTERVRINSSGAVGFAGANFGATGQMLMSQGPTASPVWAAVDALPSQTGNSGKYLTTNGTVASWNALNTDANTTTKGLYENNSVISANYTITTGNNAMSSGPITVNSGVTVTVPSGSRWAVL